MRFNPKSILISLGLLATLFLYNNCSGGGSGGGGSNVTTGDVVSRNGRKLGVDIVNETPSSSFSQNAADAKSLGAEYFIFDLVWNAVESAGTLNCNVGSYVDPGNALASFNSAAATLGLKMTLNFSPSTTNLWAAPSIFTQNDLIADPSLPATQNKIDIMACRYSNALDFVFSKLTNVEIVGLQIGNEIDYLSVANNTNFWANYWRFYASVAAHARTIRTAKITSPMSIGVTSSLAGAIGLKGNIIKSGLGTLNSTISDHWAVNYYPFENGGSDQNIDKISTQIDDLINLLGGKKARLQEFGCQNGSISSSSDALQSNCYATLFKAWDKHSSVLTHVNFLRMNDLSHTDAYNTAATYAGGTPAAEFVDYLETLGLKKYNGDQKPAYQVIKSEITKRNW